MDLRLGGMRIQADKADVFEDEQPDGTVEAAARGRGQRRLHPRRGAPVRGPDGDGRDRPRLLRERGGLRRARRLRRGPAGRARRRRHLPRRGGQVHLLRPAQPALEVHRVARATIEVDDKIMATNARLQGEGGARVLPAVPLLPDPEGRPLHRLPLPPLRPLVLPRLQGGHRVLLGHGPQPRPDLLRRLLLDDRPRLRPRAALRAAIPVAGHVPHLPLPGPGEGPRHGPRRPGRSSAAGPSAADYDIDWNALQMLPGQGPGHRERPQVQRPPLPAALPGQLQPRLEPHRALVGRAREGPQARRAERVRGHHEHLLRHRLPARQRAAARRLPAALPAPGRVGQDRLRARGDRRPHPLRQPGSRSTPGRATTSAPPSRGPSP